MAAIRQGNFLGQARIDVRDMRAIESAMAADWDIFAGQMFAGKRPSVLYGMNLLTTNAINAPALDLRVSVADALILHYGATDSGTIYRAPSDRVSEQLTTTNPRVTGSWSAGVTNYVGLVLIRTADATTADVSKFYVPDTDSEVAKTVPLGRTLDYKFFISPLPFSAQSTILPIAKVILDANSKVSGTVVLPAVAITDAREMMFSLGRGGDQPNRSPYPWPQSRVEAYGGDVFAGGDKAITSVKDWLDAAMTRIWEIGGGSAWYSPTADRNVTMVWTGDVFSNGENFEWDGTNLHWKGLKFLFDNTVATYNDVAPQTTNETQTALADGDCLYVDVDRTVNLTGVTALVANKAALATLGTGTVPGGRTILAWRSGTKIYTRNWRYPVGTTFTPATTTRLGVVKLNQTPADALLPAVVSIMANGRIEVAATAGDTPAATFRGFHRGAGVIGYGGQPVSGAGFSPIEAGVLGYGANGIASGTPTLAQGRPGTTGYGGTGGTGGAGGYHFGGAGDVILNANAIGGIGDYAEGGAGVGVGLGGVGYYGLGGLDGTGLIREAGFLAPIPPTGPLPAVAYKALAGAVEIANADTYRFGALKIGSIFLSGSDFQAETAGANTSKFFAEGAGLVPGWTSLAAGTTQISAPVRLPRGATITGAYIYTVNNSGVARNVTVTMKRNNLLGFGTPITATVIYNAVAVAIAGLTANTWTTVGAPTAAQTGTGAGTTADTAVLCKILLPATGADSDILFQGIWIPYTYTIVDFLS